MSIREIIAAILNEIKAALKEYANEAEVAFKQRIKKLLIVSIVSSVYPHRFLTIFRNINAGMASVANHRNYLSHCRCSAFHSSVFCIKKTAKNHSNTKSTFPHTPNSD